MSDPLHEHFHPSGLRLRVPKGFSLTSLPERRVVQISDGDQHVQFNVSIVRDIQAYLKALEWYEGDAMTPASPDWEDFEQLLRGKKGINLKPEWVAKRARAAGPYTYSCACASRPDGWVWDRETNRWPKAWSILEQHFPSYDRHDSIAYWCAVGAECDCCVALYVGGVVDEGYRQLVAAQRKGKNVNHP